MKRQKIFNKTVIFLLPILLIGVFFVLFFAEKPKEAFGGATDNVRGWAWSATAGWISFNCLGPGTCATVDYGVRIDNNTKNFSGYAWNDNVGWISFQESGATPDNNAFSSNCPSSCSYSSGCTACFNPATGKVWGWAKILVLGEDGWLKLRDEGAVPFGVYIDSNSEFRGWAWNDSASGGIGWTSFNCLETPPCSTSNYQVSLVGQSAPLPIDLSAPNWNFDNSCLLGAKQTILRWDVYDKDAGASQDYYQVIMSLNNSTSSGVVFDTGKRASAAKQYATSTPLSYNTHYYWWVKVWDNFGFSSPSVQFDTNINNASSTHVLTDNASGNTSSPNPNLTFTTYLHEMPEADFYYEPVEPIKGENTFFFNQAQYYSSGAPSTPINCGNNCFYLWDAQGEQSISTTTATSTIVIYNTSLSTTTSASLRVTDADGYYCSSSTTIFIDLMPKWKEVKPN